MNIMIRTVKKIHRTVDSEIKMNPRFYVLYQ